MSDDPRVRVGQVVLAGQQLLLIDIRSRLDRPATLALTGPGEMLLILGDQPGAVGLDLLTLALYLLEQLLDPCPARSRIHELPRELITALVPVELVLAAIGLDRLTDDPLSLRPQPLISAALLHRGVRRELGGVHRDRPDLHHP